MSAARAAFAFHTDRDASSESVSQRYAPPKVRTEQERSNVVQFHTREQLAEAFDAACKGAELSNRTIAASWGISEKIVRDVRKGLRPLSVQRLSLLGPRLRTALDFYLNVPEQLAFDFGKETR